MAFNEPDANLSRAEALLPTDQLEMPSNGQDLTLDQRLALAQTHALISIARSLDGINQFGITTISRR